MSYEIWDIVKPEHIPLTVDFGPIVGRRIRAQLSQMSEGKAAELLGVTKSDFEKLGDRNGPRVSGAMVLAVSQHAALDPYELIDGEARFEHEEPTLMVDHLSQLYANRPTAPPSHEETEEGKTAEPLDSPAPRVFIGPYEDVWDFDQDELRVGDHTVSLDESLARVLYQTIDRLRELSDWTWEDICSDLQVVPDTAWRLQKGMRAGHFLVHHLMERINESATLSMIQLLGLEPIPDDLYEV